MPDTSIPLSTIAMALLMTLFAGLSTGIGSLMGLLSGSRNTKFLSSALGLSAGVMVYVSFMELLPMSIDGLSDIYSERQGMIYVLTAFFLGMGFIAAIDFLIPEDENPHEMHHIHDQGKLKRTGIMLALAIGIHNFPEGIATFVSSLEDVSIAVPIVIAVAIHNIPEGIAVSVPIYHSTGSKKKAFWFSFLSGLAEPVGALFAVLFLMPFWSPEINSYCMSAVAGIMVFISFDELLPGAEEYGHHHYAIAGVITGMIVMAVSLLFL